MKYDCNPSAMIEEMNSLYNYFYEVNQFDSALLTKGELLTIIKDNCPLHCRQFGERQVIPAVTSGLYSQGVVIHKSRFCKNYHQTHGFSVSIKSF